MQTRVQDHITNQIADNLTKFADITRDNFSQKFEEARKKRTSYSNWPLATQIANKPDEILNAEEKLKAAKILGKRFAEKLAFEIFDPTLDTVAINSDKKEADIADVMANANTFSLQNCYNKLFMILRVGLRNYANSVELLASSEGVECSWENTFSQNFLNESNLTSSFDSLR